MNQTLTLDRLFTLAIPLLFIGGGVYVWIVALRGKAGKKEHPAKAGLTGEALRKYRKGEIISGTIASLGMIAFGAWLLYHWICGPAQH